jgi:Lon protease-like protein
MTSAPSPLRDVLPALSELPLFPLPLVALFPGTLMPLHIFEPRYRALIRDVIDSHQTLGIVQVIDSEMKDEHGNPAIAHVAGVGVLVDYAELPSGRFNVLVRGRARIEIEELPFKAPYRRAHAKVLQSTHETALPHDIAALISSATSFASIVHRRDSDFELKLPRDGDAGTLADQCAAQLLIDGRDRQRALETTNVIERVRLVTETIALQRLALAGESGALN